MDPIAAEIIALLGRAAVPIDHHSLSAQTGPGGPSVLVSWRGPTEPEPASPKPTVAVRIETIEDVLDGILDVGRAIVQERSAMDLIVRVRARMHGAIDHVDPYSDAIGVAFLETLDPLTIGGWWVPQLIERAGGRAVLNPTRVPEGGGAAAGPQQASRRGGPPVVVTLEALARAQPEAIVVCERGRTQEAMSDRFRALAIDPRVRDLPAVRAGRVAIVEGDRSFHHAGLGMLDALEWLVGWLQGRPELMPPNVRWTTWRGE